MTYYIDVRYEGYQLHMGKHSHVNDAYESDVIDTGLSTWHPINALVFDEDGKELEIIEGSPMAAPTDFVTHRTASCVKLRTHMCWSFEAPDGLDTSLITFSEALPRYNGQEMEPEDQDSYLPIEIVGAVR